MKNDFKDIGKELVQASKESLSARGIVAELFPYIYEASKRMSARSISRWLEDTQNIKLSHVSISKALKNADEHFEAILDNVWPAAKLIGEIFNETPLEVLYPKNAANPDLWNITELPSADEEFNDQRDALIKLRDEWFALPVRVREQCIRFLKNYNDDSE